MVVARGTWVQGMVGKCAWVRAHFRVTQNLQQRLLNCTQNERREFTKRSPEGQPCR